MGTKIKIHLIDIETDDPAVLQQALRAFGDLIGAALPPATPPKLPPKRKPRAIRGQVVEIKQPKAE